MSSTDKYVLIALHRLLALAAMLVVAVIGFFSFNAAMGLQAGAAMLLGISGFLWWRGHLPNGYNALPAGLSAMMPPLAPHKRNRDDFDLAIKSTFRRWSPFALAGSGGLLGASLAV
jgi:hypothetical protein